MRSTTARIEPGAAPRPSIGLAAQPERDAFTAFIAEVRDIGGGAARAVMSAAKAQWMSGDFSNAAVRRCLVRIRTNSHGKPDIIAACDRAVAKIQRGRDTVAPSLLAYYENRYGRRFETAAARLFILEP